MIMEEMEAGLLTECCELLNTISGYPENKKCFDCSDNHSPRYLCTTFSTFVCSCCATIHQEFGHKIKVLSVFSFTVNEIYVLKETGNRVAGDKWLARWRPEQYPEPNPSSVNYKEEARLYMRAKYIEKKWVKMPPPLPVGDMSRSRGASVSPRGAAEVSPRYGTADVSPRKSADVSPRDAIADADIMRDDQPQQQPSVVYVTQPMYIPYPVPMDISPAATMSTTPPAPNPFYPQTTIPFCSYPFDNSTHFMVADNVSWPGAKRNSICVPSVSYRDLRPQPIDDCVQPTGILRSVSDISLNTSATRLQQPLENEECIAGACKCSNCSATNNSNSQTVTNLKEAKAKIQGVMSKVSKVTSNLLRKSQA